MDDFAEPFDRCWQALQMLQTRDHAPDVATVSETLLAAIGNCEDRLDILKTILTATPGYRPLHCLTFTELLADYEPPEWLWEGWIPSAR